MILVLGATGFVGKAVCRNLDRKGLNYQRSSLSLGADLRDREAARCLFAQVKPGKVINCAAFVGGIQFGYKFPVELFESNLLMTLNILACCDEFKVQRLVNPISNCAYPGRATLFKEDEFWDGPLHESVLAYGFVRKASWVGSWAYQKQKGLDAINLIVSNMYGPEDHSEEARSHALGALVMKFVKAQETKAPQVVVWGSGEPVREWLFVEDGAEALVRGLDVAPFVDPINIGVAHGISIAELARLIRDKVGYRGEIVFDRTKPDGAPHKTVDGRRGRERLGWSPATPLEQGIQQTIDWYRRHG